MTENLPKITKADVLRLANQQSFERGEKYYRQGAIFDPVRQENELRAYCEGSSYEPYRVSATLAPNGIAGTECTCPYNWGGICKHIVALLLTWVHEPERFDEIPPIDETLANRSKEELIGLIKEMLKREPDLARLLELPLQPDRNTPLDENAFRRQVTYALRQQDYYDFPNANAVATELAAIVDTADRFREGGDWANAGAMYALVLSEVVPQYDELYDEDGDVAIELQRCAEGLEHCFNDGEPDADTRRTWLEALLEAELKNVEMGGIDLAYPAGEVLIQQAIDEEWAWIEQRVRQAITAQTGSFSDWPRQWLVNFLTHRLEVTGQYEETDELILNLGTPQQRAYLLIERGRFDEAVAIAKRHFEELPGLVTQFADALVEAGADENAEAYVAGLLEARQGQTYLSWLAKHAEKRGKLSAALDLWRRGLLQTPSFQTYRGIRDIAEQLGQWQGTRQELLASLEAKEVWHVLLEIALDEGDVGRALELLPRLKGWFSRDYELRVAQVGEESHPEEALRIYGRRIEQLIDARGRENYRSAAEKLTRVRKIYERQDDQDSWRDYIKSLRHENRNLPAFQDELNKAGL